MHHHSHHHLHHHHHHLHSSSSSNTPLTQEERVKASRALLFVSVFVIIFAIVFIIAAIHIFQRGTFSPYMLLPFIPLPLAMIVFSIIAIVRAAKSLNNVPTALEDVTQEKEAKSEEASTIEASTASPVTPTSVAQNCVCPKCGFIYGRKEEKCPQCGEPTKID